MSECIGEGCTHQDCNHATSAPTPAEVRSALAGMAAGYAPEKWAAMPRRERRAAVRATRRRGVFA